MRMNPGTRNAVRSAYTLVVAVVGATIVLFGLVLLVLPGPGLAVVAAGLAILASEFAWARRLLKRVKKDVEQGINDLRR